MQINMFKVYYNSTNYIVCLHWYILTFYRSNCLTNTIVAQLHYVNRTKYKFSQSYVHHLLVLHSIFMSPL